MGVYVDEDVVALKTSLGRTQSGNRSPNRASILFFTTQRDLTARQRGYKTK